MTNDFETMPTGSRKILTDQDIELHQLRDKLAEAESGPTATRLGERIARRDAKIQTLERTIKRLEGELAKERLAADFMR